MTRQEAWNVADKIFPGDYLYDSFLSRKSGYPVYASVHSERPYDYICNLNARLEVNIGGKSINLWID